MSNKVKVTGKQDEVFKELKKEQWRPHAIVNMVADNRRGYVKQEYLKVLRSMSLDRVIRALYFGYEVEPEFKVGDFVVYIHNNTVWEVVGELYGGKVHYDIARNGKHRVSVHKDHIILATPSEIKQEKERRWWDGHGREVWELKQGDLLCDIDNNQIVRVKKVKEDHALIGHYTSYDHVDYIKKYYLVSCFKENRLDVSVDE